MFENQNANICKIYNLFKEVLKLAHYGGVICCYIPCCTVFLMFFLEPEQGVRPLVRAWEEGPYGQKRRVLVKYSSYFNNHSSTVKRHSPTLGHYLKFKNENL
ncbi:Hypothetical membrane protein [Zobellia galactanivorans]|uniref:Hypothetical membrane protein n=1 Tax=Zobellia galactanivorans (strain DSM 12802 / CCUG 47099 / CIP 106680 / NCIMB 13871 / Dsij) TaxID=63186 RepID=G0KZQ8_ZOBGA|nr:Hypothetical membrane protein [Zobellia galactanivorans]